MRSFEHAAAARSTAESVVVRLAYSDGTEGWGETLPRAYVTGETIDTVLQDLREVLWPLVRSRPLPLPPPTQTGGVGGTPPPSLLGAPSLPMRSAEGRCINAAAAAVDVAEVDRLLQEPAQWAGRPGGRIAARVSGVLGSADPAKTAKRVRLMRAYGLRDFKLKLGFGDDIDAENLRIVTRRVGRAIARGACTLRVDVNGGWDADTTPERADELKAHGVCCIEQPVFCAAGELLDLARRCPVPLMADESLLSSVDADTLLPDPQRVWWNVRISKNGGMRAAVRLLERAREHGVLCSLGCMVGESGLLSGAQRRVLQWVGSPRFVEGNYGRFLLADDLTRPSPRFGYGGRLRPLREGGLGVRVDAGKLAAYGTRVLDLE